MASVGETLQRKRLALGISLEEISKQTKIGARLLQAIETGQFQRLPGGIFTRSFLQQYARAVGLDENAILQQYAEESGEPLRPHGREAGIRETSVRERGRELQPLERVSSSPGGHGSPGYPRIILSAVALGVLVGGGLLALHRHFTAKTPASRAAASSPAASREAESPSAGASGAPKPEQPQPAVVSFAPASGTPVSDSAPAAAGAPATAPPSTAPGASGAATKPVSSSGPAASSAPAAAAAPAASHSLDAPASPAQLALQVSARDGVWVAISVDGALQYQGTLRAHEAREVTAKDSIELTVGDAASVDLMLNGRPLPRLGRPGEVKKLTLTSRDIAPAAP